MKDETFDEGMIVLGTIFLSLQPNVAMLKIWRQLLRDLEDEVYLTAIGRICNEVEEIFPGSTNIVALIRKYAQGTPQDLHTQALLVWQQVIEAIEHVGTYESVIFSDPAIHSCIKALGGWVELGQTLREEMVWKEKKFLELYPIYSQMSCHPKKLAGITEITNHAEGFPRDIPEPVMIGFGDEIKALKE